MRIYYEKSLRDFCNECSAHTCECIEKLDEIGKLDELEKELKSVYIDGIYSEDLDDLFCDDFDFILSLIGMTER